jgi:transcriptional regulator with AAA-type ATPase domain
MTGDKTNRMPPLAGGELDRISGAYPHATYRAGEIIVGGGAEGGAFFHLLREGEAEVVWRDTRGRVVPIASYRPGDGIWRDVGVASTSGSFLIRAVTDVRVTVLDEREYYRLVAEDPRLNVQLSRAFTASVLKANLFLEEILRRRSLQERYTAEAASFWDDPWITASPAMRALEEEIHRLATTPGPVLIEAEYGSGKHLAAVRIHREGSGSPTDFIPLDGGSLDQGNWEEALFGRGTSGEGFQRVFGALELAEGGTLYLRNCDKLPREAQEALAGSIGTGLYHRAGSSRQRALGCRVVLGTRGETAEAGARGSLHPPLLSLVEGRRLRIPPLRDRKRDIPPLAEHYVARHAAEQGVRIDEITPEAMKTLVSHDYRLANVLELRQVLERAVPLPHDHRIRPRHLFLGAPAVPLDRWHFDLLGIPRLRRWVTEGRYPGIPQAASAVVFALIIAFLLFGPADSTLGTRLVWGLWWPLMFLSFFWVGRSWCAVCPYSTYARLGQRFAKREIRPPEWLRQHGPVVMALALLLVLWIEEATGMHASARATGLLMSSILALALLSALLFQRETWCRFLCPLGGLVGVSAMCSILEVRSNVDVCRTRCRRSECYHGTEALPGCPTFEHLLFLDSNQTCKMCLRCVRNCPHRSVAFNLRLPGREIWLLNQKHGEMSLFIPVLLGAVLPPLMLQSRGLSPAAPQWRGVFTAAHWLAPVAVFLLLWLPNLLCREGGWAVGWRRFWMTSYAYVPLAVATHLAYRLEHAVGRETVGYTVRMAGGILREGSFLEMVQVAVVAAGTLYAAFCLSRVRARREGGDFQAGPGFWWGHSLLLWGYAALAVILILGA